MGCKQSSSVKEDTPEASAGAGDCSVGSCAETKDNSTGFTIEGNPEVEEVQNTKTSEISLKDNPTDFTIEGNPEVEEVQNTKISEISLQAVSEEPTPNGDNENEGGNDSDHGEDD